MKNKINVVQLNSALANSTAPYRLHQALLEYSIDVNPYFLSKWDVRTSEYDKMDPHACSVDVFQRGKLSRPKHIWFSLPNFIQEKLDKARLKRYSIAQWGIFHTGYTGFPVHRLPTTKKADIIHLNWLADFISDSEIKQLGKNKPIVWTMHDCGNITGGSHVCYDCENFTNGCGFCPCLSSEKEKDLSAKINKRRQKLFKNLNITFVAPSNWMKQQILNSSIGKGHNCIVIPNTIDTDIFAPRTKTENISILEEYLSTNQGSATMLNSYLLSKSSNADRISILFGAVSLSIPHKGYQYLIEMIDLLREQYPNIYSKIDIHTIGGSTTTDIPSDIPCYNWGYVNDTNVLSSIYSLMDVLVFPTLSDNFPGVVLESLSCGTPVVAFNTGGVSDLVEHKKNGYLAQYKNSQDLLDGFIWIVENNINNILGNAGRDKVLSNYTYKIISSKYTELYKSNIVNH